MTAMKLLSRLLDGNEPVPDGPGVGDAAEALEADGCVIERVWVDDVEALRLVRTAPGVWADYLRHVLGPHRHVEVYRRLGSTQDAARRLARTMPTRCDGAVVVADEQTAGRGRLGRAWLSPPGTAATFSTLFRTAPDAVDRLTFAASVGLCDALGPPLAAAGHDCRIKWPNDIFVGDRKLAGILVEQADDLAVIGVGINVSLDPAALPAELQPVATSLAALGVQLDRLAVLATVLQALERALRDMPEAQLLDAWRRRCHLIDREASFVCHGRPVTGTVIDLDPHLGLIVRRSTGELVHLPAAVTSTAWADEANPSRTVTGFSR